MKTKIRLGEYVSGSVYSSVWRLVRVSVRSSVFTSVNISTISSIQFLVSGSVRRLLVEPVNNSIKDNL